MKRKYFLTFGAVVFIFFLGFLSGRKFHRMEQKTVANGASVGPGLQVCEADIKKFCSNVPFGDGRIRKCLELNLVSLSPGCAAINDPKRKRPAAVHGN